MKVRPKSRWKTSRTRYKTPHLTLTLTLTLTNVQCAKEKNNMWKNEDEIDESQPQLKFECGVYLLNHTTKIKILKNINWAFLNSGWLCSRVVSVLDGLRRRRARVQIAAATLSGNSLRQTVHTHRASRHLQADCQGPGQLRNPTLGNRVWATFAF